MLGVHILNCWSIFYQQLPGFTNSPATFPPAGSGLFVWKQKGSGYTEEAEMQGRELRGQECWLYGFGASSA